MTRYTDYNFYEGQYGGTLTQEQFQKVILPVSAYLRRFTFGRADSGMEEVQYAACACCDLLHRERATASQYGGRRVASENTDGYAVSYVQEQDAGMTGEEVLSRKLYQEAALYLEPTGLFDLGVYTDADEHGRHPLQPEI